MKIIILLYKIWLVMGSGSRVYDDFDADEDAEYADISDDADGDGD